MTNPRTKTGTDRLDPGARTAARILLAEDDAEMRALLDAVLRNEGYDVVGCEDGFRLAEEVGTSMIPGEMEHFDLIVSDNRLPGVSGMEILEAVSEWPGSPPLILITAFGDEAAHAEAARLGVAEFLDKPFEMPRFTEAVRTVLAAGSATDR